MGRFLTTTEKASELGVSPRTLHYWKRAGRLRPVGRWPGGALQWEPAPNHVFTPVIRGEVLVCKVCGRQRRGHKEQT